METVSQESTRSDFVSIGGALARDAGPMFLVRLVGAAANFTVLLVLIYRLPEAEVGLYYFLVNLWNILNVLVDFGGDPMATREIARHPEREGPVLRDFLSAKAVCPRVRLRRDVLDELEVYAEALRRERNAQHIQIDLDKVWAAGPASEPAGETARQIPGDDATTRPAGKPDTDAVRREDEWLRSQSAGAMAGVSLDPEHWICFGLGERLPVLVTGGDVFMSRHPVSTPARFATRDGLRLSGLLWPEARERLAAAPT